MHSLNDVDFSFVWPVVAAQPVGRPCTTTFWHVIQIHDEQSTVELSSARNSDRVTSSALCDVLVVGADVHWLVVELSADVALGKSCVPVNVVHVAVSRIVPSPKVEVVEKASPFEVMLPPVTAFHLTEANQQNKKDTSELHRLDY